jgi:midasin (ATPase involved in ribosome maturation)
MRRPRERAKHPLTPKQQHLKREIEEIASIISMDHWNILAYHEESRTTYLELMKNKLIRADIIMKYTLIDEFLTVIIVHFYFPRKNKNTSFRAQWRSKRFQIFNHYLMEETYLLSKMRVVRAIDEVPSKIRDIIERINALRNAVAHSFFPENRRQYVGYKKVVYNNIDIYTTAGVRRLSDDFDVVSEYLRERAFGA